MAVRIAVTFASLSAAKIASASSPAHDLGAVRRLASGERLDARRLGHRPYERRHPRTEAHAYLEQGDLAALHHVVEQPGGDHVVGIAGVAEQRRDAERVLEVGTSVRVLALPGMGARR
jgi:hypothetical protein